MTDLGECNGKFKTIGNRRTRSSEAGYSGRNGSWNQPLIPGRLSGKSLSLIHILQIGTRFVVSDESIVHENYKQRIIKAKDIDSAVTGRSHGHPVRCLRNQMTREYVKQMCIRDRKGEVHSVSVLRQLVKVIVITKDEKEIREYRVDQLKFKPRRRKDKGSVADAELKALEALEKKEGKSKLDDN